MPSPFLTPAASAPGSKPGARFVTGSIMRHVVVMAATSAIGLVAVFGVDMLNLFYLSRLGVVAIAAAIGFAGAVGFFQFSIAIGLTIGIGAIVSTEIGAGRMEPARRIATASLLAVACLTLLVGCLTVAARGPILTLLGAEGETRRLASLFIAITSPSIPLVAAGMGCAALLRSVGDARRSMNVTLFAAVATAGLDPLFIFALHMGFAGAAVSTVLSRLLLLSLGLYYVLRHQLLGRPDFARALADLRLVSRVALPAIMTNLATPVGSAYVTHAMARFGTEAVAGQATIDRVTPVAFGLVFALTGAVGPIMAQNLGAGRPDRVAETLRGALVFMTAAVLGAWAILAALQGPLIIAFSARGMAAEIVRMFCSWLAAGFLFVGALFVANAAFNNLNRPLLATLFNWGRATLGTIPFVTFGAQYGPIGVLAGQVAGSVVFGSLAMLTAFAVTRRLARGPGTAGPSVSVPVITGKAAMAAISSAPDGRSV